ncbi:hypothetical protein GUITHDRAFT_160972 [Guillardia theta CCMP2712]|uniref:Uncharacterized protein n=2 Tax=Guillardia theta TaxID=55529 RepID=L1JYM0_GUITC|nr:hypothetical protein GUITHDRAFT_160972 [Guillardia theta CCMP2712]EKX53188.1 hypothetical protein GUITHDRAFT_160972 [Guillardia theta CCMP2712]|mmetsp:Transcript_33984/g.106504  ORF Transcript_33984/g.106504 Transcript_33984/m.106504 type:complete len:332 (+) Transcript_33984:260-1255(+)|eukprot:XP_005840168.1 hypothetical protein GUITHDRAFT_160972 [Guillardia theta CCMP2712]
MTGLLNGLVDAVECSINLESVDASAHVGPKRKISYQTALEDLPAGTHRSAKRSRSSSDSDGEKEGKENGGGPSFLKFLELLEKDGVVTRHMGDVPPTLRGIAGWTVNDGMMEEWQRRRREWFMEGKEGKEYKPNSLYQILRRLGFFPTERTKRASHGFDFEGSRSFQWDGSQRYVQNRGKAGKGKDNGSTSACSASDDSKSPVSEVSSPSSDLSSSKDCLPSFATSPSVPCGVKTEVSSTSRPELAIDLSKLLACTQRSIPNFQACSSLAQLHLPLSAPLGNQLNSSLLQQQINFLAKSNQLNILSLLSNRPMALTCVQMNLAPSTTIGSW